MKTFTHEEDPPIFSYFDKTTVFANGARVVWLEDNLQPAFITVNDERWVIVGEDFENQTMVVRRST